MDIYQNVIFSEAECDELLNSAVEFVPSKLYYTGDKGIKHEIVSKNQRNSLQYDFNLYKDSILYNKLSSILEKSGYKLNAPSILCNLIRYETGHFIFKHRHDTDGDSFLTFVVQLDNSENYEGGDFLYWVNGEELTMDRTKGYGVMLPANIEHEVKTIINGVRHSFVVFIKITDLERISKAKLF